MPDIKDFNTHCTNELSSQKCAPVIPVAIDSLTEKWKNTIRQARLNLKSTRLLLKHCK